MFGVTYQVLLDGTALLLPQYCGTQGRLLYINDGANAPWKK